MGLRVEEDCLPRGMNGYYCDALGLIVLHDKLNARQRLCTLQHELIHAHYHDIGCGSIAGLKAELRARRETALTLISPIEYQLAESAYDGEAYSMAVELGVTMQVLKDYQTRNRSHRRTRQRHRHLRPQNGARGRGANHRVHRHRHRPSVPGGEPRPAETHRKRRARAVPVHAGRRTDQTDVPDA